MSLYDQLRGTHKTSPSPDSIASISDFLSKDRLQHAVSDTVLSSTDRRVIDDPGGYLCSPIHHYSSCSTPISRARSNSSNSRSSYGWPHTGNQETSTPEPEGDSFSSHQTVLIYKEPSRHSSHYGVAPSEYPCSIDTSSSERNEKPKTRAGKLKDLLDHIRLRPRASTTSSRRTLSSESCPTGKTWENRSGTRILDYMSFQLPSARSAHYVKLRPRHKHVKDLDRLIYAQTLKVNGSHTSEQVSKPSTTQQQQQQQQTREQTTIRENEDKISTTSSRRHHPHGIWAMNFSQDGKYLAAAGRDHVIRVWKVRDGAQTVQREESGNDQHASGSQQERMTLSVFDEKPVKEFTGHTDDILALRWSKNGFLLSASLDNTAMLWHIYVNECLCVFQHVDFVTGVVFHPLDDRLFVSGSADGKIRVWSIPEKRVVRWTTSPDRSVVTAVGFTPDGQTVCAGSHNGQLFLHDAADLKYTGRMELKRRHAKRGCKITGIELMPETVEPIVLVTSNDSEMRLIHAGDKRVLREYFGAENESSQIKASFSDDARYIVCGSDRHTVHIWSTHPSSLSADHTHMRQSSSDANLAGAVVAGGNDDDGNTGKSANRRLSHWMHGGGEQRWRERLMYNHERYFAAGQGMVTRVIFAPTSTRQQLAISGTDMIYNNTPIAYVHHDASRPSSNKNPDIRVSHAMPHLDSIKDDYENQEELLERAKYEYTDGHILVTANDRGEIKVWRFDSGVYPGALSSIGAVGDDGSKMPSMHASLSNDLRASDHQHHRPRSFPSVVARPSLKALVRPSNK